MTLTEHQQRSIDEAADRIKDAHHIAVFTGAGVSKESGIDTFRDEGGLWDAFDMSEFGTATGLAKLMATNPKKLAEFLEAVLHPVAQAAPNPAHHAIATLEKAYDISVITQNVDGLHQEAGSTLVREVHGSLTHIVDARGTTLRRLLRQDLEAITSRLARVHSTRFPRWRLLRSIRPLFGLETSTKTLVHRPNLVLFGEMLAEPSWTQAQSDVRTCDALLVIGTSGEVYPAAQLPDAVRDRGRPVIGIGPEEGEADVWIHGPAGLILPALAGQLVAPTGK